MLLSVLYKLTVCSQSPKTPYRGNGAGPYQTAITSTITQQYRVIDARNCDSASAQVGSPGGDHRATEQRVTWR